MKVTQMSWVHEYREINKQTWPEVIMYQCWVPRVFRESEPEVTLRWPRMKLTLGCPQGTNILRYKICGTVRLPHIKVVLGCHEPVIRWKSVPRRLPLWRCACSGPSWLRAVPSWPHSENKLSTCEVRLPLLHTMGSHGASDHWLCEAMM